MDVGGNQTKNLGVTLLIRSVHIDRACLFTAFYIFSNGDKNILA